MSHLQHDPNAVAYGDTTMELWGVLPQSFEIRDGHLFIGGVDCVALAKEFGTALYVLDVAEIKGRLADYKRAFVVDENSTPPSDVVDNAPQNQIVYAGKAFICKAMCRLLQEQGCWLDVSSGGELALALAAGFDPAQILMHGNNKSPCELREALDAGVGLIVVDCFEELERLNHLVFSSVAEEALNPANPGNSVASLDSADCSDSQDSATYPDPVASLSSPASHIAPQPILLRVKPGVVADTHDYIRTGAEDSKFGFGLSDGMAARAVERALELPGVSLLGLHVHIGSQIFALDAYRETLDVLAEFLRQMQDEFGFATQVLDLGGGLGVAYQKADQPAAIQDLGALLTSHLRTVCERHGLPLPSLLVEPGRSIVANAGVTLYTVGAIKEIPGVRSYVAIDGGISDNVRTVLYGARYETVLANRAGERRTRLVTLAGKHCESGDMVAIDSSIQPPQPGDIVAVLATGAYCASMSSNYNKQVRPGVVFVQDGQATEVVRRETYADLLRCDVG